MGRLQKLAPRITSSAPRIGSSVGDSRSHDREREARAPWRKWYRTARWGRLRLKVFERDLFQCQMDGCGRIEGNLSKLVCDHVRPHRGDQRLFWDDRNLQTLCKPCHDSLKQRQERREG
ncbi:MAG: HNH endonuclease [Martelella sp.]|uniref:HNH endonuclease n=1 Tax=unclassified Martelella TaxID=2629616 RepID=UPI000C392BC8|nr:HNH endonuclease signature motif containing protein [Martelella sp.]MAU22556.1 HNH endonuclease [Martelella sp.]